MKRRYGWGQANRIIARAREEARSRQDADPLASKPCREPRREGDEYVCGKCLARWGSDEGRPACPYKGDI